MLKDKKESAKKPVLSTSLANKTTIYIWLPDKTRWGHVAMRTYRGGFKNEGNYISFWPGAISDESKSKSIAFWSGIKDPEIVKDSKKTGKFFGYLRDMENEKTIEEMLETDCSVAYENGRPNHTIDLYSLSTEKINKTYDLFRSSGCNWAFLNIGSFRDFFFQKDSKNCCSLCLYLLCCGGLSISMYDRKTFVSVKDVVLISTFILASAGAYFGVPGFNALRFIAPAFLGSGADVWQNINNISTPIGMSMLMTRAQENELSKFILKDAVEQEAVLKSKL